MSMRKQLVEIDAEIWEEREKSYIIFCGDEDHKGEPITHAIPKSQTVNIDEKRGRMKIPMWLAVEKDIIHTATGETDDELGS